MKSLLIDTSSSYVTVKIVIDDAIVASFYDKITDDMSSKIFPIIENLFKISKINIKDINKIYVVNGPGSFTGVRIGVTIAKVLASQFNIEICPISSLEFQASGALNNSLVLIDAKRGYVYAGGYDKDLNCIFKDQYIKYEDIDLTKFETIISYDDFSKILPNPNVLKILNKYNNKSVNPHKVNPNYLKLTEAEEKLREKND